MKSTQLVLSYLSITANPYLASAQQKWGYEGPENWQKTSLCGPIPPSIMYKIQSEYFHITHNIRTSKKTGELREFADARPSLQVLKRCDPKFENPDEFSFKIKCEVYRYKGEDFKEWVIIQEKMPKKLCLMDEENDKPKAWEAGTGRSISFSSNGDSDSPWGYELFKEYDTYGCGPVKFKETERNRELNLENLDFKNYYVEYKMRQKGRLQANIYPIDTSKCQDKNTFLGTTIKTYCNMVTKKWIVRRCATNLCGQIEKIVNDDQDTYRKVKNTSNTKRKEKVDETVDVDIDYETYDLETLMEKFKEAEDRVKMINDVPDEGFNPFA